MQNSTKMPFLNPVWILRLEAFVWFCLSLALFYGTQGCWWLFTLVFFVPDLSLAAYAFGPKVGAFTYNFFHTEIWAVLLILACFFLGEFLLFQAGLIWLCHVNFDRMLGLGLKEPSSFENTHLGTVAFWKNKIHK